MRLRLATAACWAAIGITFAMSAARAADWTPLPPVAAPPPAALPAAAAQAAVVPQIDPAADRVLGQTCQILGSAEAFTFHAEILFDQVLPSEVKVQFAGAIDFAVQRPDELSIDYHSDLGGKELWYRKNSLTVFDQPHQMYASLQVPDSIDQMLDRVAEVHNLKLPLSNFAYSDPCQRIRKQILFGTYVGVNDVNCLPCDHLAFSSRNIDIQLWTAHNGKPLPRKLVINYRTEPGSPEFIAVLSDWKFPPRIAASRFQPRVPKNAKRIEFLKVNEAQ